MTQDNPLYWNLQFVEWYFNTSKVILDLKNEHNKDKILNIFTLAIGEDPYAFTRFVLWIANTRKNSYQEIVYNAICHYIAIFWPHFLAANLHLFMQIGRKDDILYFLKVPQIQQKIYTWIKIQAKDDKDFQHLIENGTIIGKRSKIKIRYKPVKKDYVTFLDKVLDDPNFNGIQAGDLDNNAIIESGTVIED